MLRGWARLIERVYVVDPLLCPCGETTRILYGHFHHEISELAPRREIDPFRRVLI